MWLYFQHDEARLGPLLRTIFDKSVSQLHSNDQEETAFSGTRRLPCLVGTRANFCRLLCPKLRYLMYCR